MFRLFFLLSSAVLSSDSDFETVITSLLGVGDILEVSAADYEHFENLYRHPLKINSASRKQLQSSGLFSTYQLESLLDYISRNSSILSSSELASVDGFTPQSASLLAPFIDFAFAEKPASNFTLSADTGAGVRIQDGSGTVQWYGKCVTSYGSGWGEVSASVAAKSPYARPVAAPSSVGWTVACEGKRGGVRGGYFNARYGQGLIQWSGFRSSNNLANPSSLMKRPAGITPYTSYSTDNAMYGVAADLVLEHFAGSAFADIRGRNYGGNIAWNHKNGELGASIVASQSDLSCSIDFQQTIKGKVLYGEAAYSTLMHTAYLLSGALIPIGTVVSGARLSFSLYEHNVTLSGDWLSSDRRHDLSSGLSLSYYQKAKGQTPSGACQMKFLLVYSATFVDFLLLTCKINCKFKALTKYSDPSASYASSWGESKLQLREDLKWDNGKWLAAFRLDIQHCKGMSYLCSIEGGRKAGSWAGYCQCGLFSADCWDDRLYIYQRDAPPSFNMKALYGHGMWISAFASASIGKHVKLYARAGYSFNLKARTDQLVKDRPAADARVQCSVEF